MNSRLLGLSEITSTTDSFRRDMSFKVRTREVVDSPPPKPRRNFPIGQERREDHPTMFAATMNEQAFVRAQAPKIVRRNDKFILEADVSLMAIATRGCGDFAFLAFAQPSCGFLGVFPIRRREAHPVA